HDHPFDKWTQEEFYGMASFFTEVRVRRDAKDTEMRGYHVEETRRGPIGKRMAEGGPNLMIPDSKSGPIKPAFIETGKGAEAGVSRRAAHAQCVSGGATPPFADV